MLSEIYVAVFNSLLIKTTYWCEKCILVQLFYASSIIPNNLIIIQLNVQMDYIPLVPAFENWGIPTSKALQTRGVFVILVGFTCSLFWLNVTVSLLIKPEGNEVHWSVLNKESSYCAAPIT